MDSIPVNIYNNSEADPIRLKISYDYYGNVYIDASCLKEDTFFLPSVKDYIYQLNIDGYNNLFMEPGTYKIYDTDITKKTYELKHIEPKPKPESEPKLELEPTLEEEEEPEYFPEEDQYYINKNDDSDNEYIYEDIEKQYGVYNKRFNFSSSITCIPIEMREDGEVSALYDSYIYNNNNVCMVSNSANEDTYYRIKLHMDTGIIQFRPLGGEEKTYKLYIKPTGELLCI